MAADLIKEALRNLRQHTGRSIATLFGIVWGVALVMLLVAWGTGMRDSLVEQASSGGRRMLAFFPGRSSSGVGANAGGREIKLTMEDAALLKSQLPALDHTAAGAIRWGGIYVRYRTDFRRAVTFGVQPEIQPIMELAIAHGRFFSAQDMALSRRVAVLGAALAEKIFGQRSPVGERVEVSGVGYRVIGVLVRKGDQISSLGPPDDNKLFVPLSTYQSLIAGEDKIGFLAVQPHDISLHKDIAQQVRKVLGARHGFAADDRDAIDVFDVVNFIDLFRNLTTAIRLFVSALGIVSLAIGGVGVMNILLLAVTERSREIGLRKALGATRRDIATQFLAEALVMAALGGTVGMALGWLLCQLAGTQGSVHIPQYLSGGIVAASVGLIGVVGITAGLWPALRAARIDPVRALRFE